MRPVQTAARCGAFASFFLLTLGSSCVYAAARGPIESYLLKGLAVEEQMEVRAAFVPLSESSQGLAACESLAMPTVRGQRLVAKRAARTIFGTEVEACEVSWRALAPGDMTLFAWTPGDGEWQIGCSTTVEARLAPQDCLDDGADTESAPSTPGVAARLAAVGATSGVEALRRELASREIEASDAEDALLVRLQVEAREAYRDSGRAGLAAFVGRHEALLRPRDPETRTIPDTGFDFKLALALELGECVDWPSQFDLPHIMISGHSEIVDARLANARQLCGFCTAKPDAQREEIRKWLAPSSDQVAELVGVLNYGCGVEAMSTWSRPQLEAALRGAAPDKVELQEQILDAYDRQHGKPDAVPAYLQSALDRTPVPVFSSLDEQYTRDWLLDFHGDPAARLIALARHDVEFALARPVPDGLRDKFVQARLLDQAFYLLTMAYVSSDYAIAALERVSELAASDPLAAPAAALAHAYALVVAGRFGELDQYLAEHEPEVLAGLRTLTLNEQAIESVSQFIAMSRAAAAGELARVFELAGAIAGPCDSPLFDEVGCARLRITVAEMAVSAGDLNTARKFLADFPTDDALGGHDAAAPVQADYYAVLARLALAEGDSKTASTALSRAAAANPDAQLSIVASLASIRTHLLSGATEAAQISISASRPSVADLPAGARVQVEHELAADTWVATRSPAAVKGVLAASAAEQEFLGRGLQGADADAARTLLNSRAQRRNVNLSIALAADASGGGALAFSEAGWFKGLEEAHAAAVLAGKALQPFDAKGGQWRQALGEGTVVADFVVFDRVEFPAFRATEVRLAAVVYGASEEPVLVDVGPYAPIAAQIGTLRKAIVARQPAEASARELATMLFGKLGPQIGKASRLVVVPDAQLHLVPFDYLREQAPAAFGSASSLFVAGSLRQLVAPHVSSSARDVMVIAGPDFGAASGDTSWPPLPGAAAEGEAVAAVWTPSSPTRQMQGAAASEAALKQLTTARILHIATHGFARGNLATDADGTRGLKVVPVPVVATPERRQAPTSKAQAALPPAAQLLRNYEDPLRQVGLVLAGANARQSTSPDNDGVLDGREVVAMHLRGTALVVLSACETGTGETLPGAAVGSLQRAFQQAGAANVVSTLWPIPDDASRVLLTGFHERLAKGAPPAQALADAKKQVRAMSGYAPPFFWAAFQLSGALP